MKNLFCYKAYTLCVGFFFFGCGYSNCQDQSIADSLITIYEREHLPDSTRLELLRTIAFNQRKPDLKLFYANALIEVASKNNKNEWLYRGYFLQGTANRYKGDLEESIQSYFKCAELVMLTDGKEFLGEPYLALGDVYSMNSDHKNSVHYYKKAIGLLRAEDEPMTLATALLNLGDEYLTFQQLDSALWCFEESKRIFTQLDYRMGIAYNIGNIGMVYAKQGRNNLAEQNIDDAVNILKELGDVYAIAVYDTYMADIYKDKGDYQRALEYANRSHEKAAKGGFKEQIRDASLKLSELYSDLKDYEKAFNFQSQYIAYRDSINNEETIRKMADLRTEYEVSQKQAEVDLLNVQKRNQQIIGAGLATVILLVGALALMFYRNSVQRQHTNQILSEQKEEIETQRDQLDELNKSKDKFFSIISHDLRGPVHAFKGMSRLIKMYIDHNCIDELAELNQHFDSSVDQLSTLLDDLLDWAVSQQGKVPYTPEVVSLHDLSEDIMGLFDNMAQAKKIKLTTAIPEDIQLWVDSNSLRTILRNLVNNSLKFTDEGGSVTISAEKDDDMAAVHVADTGRGIPENQLETLFKLAEHKRSWGTEGEKGLGLGLQLVYSFSEMNGGSITVESEEGVGTTFTIHMPLYQPESAPEIINS